MDEARESPEITPRAGMSRLQVRVGNPAFPPGLTQVEVDAEGRLAVVTELEGRDTRRAEAKLEPERARQLLGAAEATAARVRGSDRLGLPDEPRYRFTFETGAGQMTVELWRSELKEHPELGRVVSELQGALAEQVGKDVVL